MTRLSESCYLQLVPSYRWTTDRTPTGFSVQRVTQSKPSSPLPDAVVVKVNLSISDEAFEQLPIANVDIPLSAVSQVNVEATA